MGVYLRGTDGQDVNNVIDNNTLTRTGNDALYVLEGSGNTFRDNTISEVTSQILGLSVGGGGCDIGLQQSANTIVEHSAISNVREVASITTTKREARFVTATATIREPAGQHPTVPGFQSITTSSI